MIHIEQNQKIQDSENLIVATATGDYADDALIEFFDISDPTIIAGAFQAQYVCYGGLVYKFNSHKELGEALLKIDPKSTHTAASYVRMTNELLAQMDGGSLEPTSLDEVISTEQANTEDKIVDDTMEITPDTDTATTTPDGIPDTDTATTTPDGIPDTATTTPDGIPDTATTTPDMVPEVEGVATTTTEVIPDIDTSSTTPVILETLPNEASTSGDSVVSLKRTIRKKLS